MARGGRYLTDAELSKLISDARAAERQRILSVIQTRGVGRKCWITYFDICEALKL